MFSSGIESAGAKKAGFIVAGFYFLLLLFFHGYYELFFSSVISEGWVINVLTATFFHFVIPILFLPVLLKISAIFPLLKRWYNVLLHLVFSLTYVALFVFLLSFLDLAVEGYFMFTEPGEYVISLLNRQLLVSGSSAFVSYWGIVVFSGLHVYFSQLTKVVKRSFKLEEQLSKATLSTLKAQLKPHFLFNTLNMVDYLVHTDHQKAVVTLSRLEDLIKSTFDKHQPNTCTVQSEVNFLEKYLEIEQSRFIDRLQVNYEIASETKPIEIPCYLVQPLVENSIKHAVGKMLNSCVITIRATLKEEGLSIEVEDNGVSDVKNNGELIWGVGLRNVDDRLKLFYGEDAKLEIGFLKEEGFRSHVLIPKKYLEL